MEYGKLATESRNPRSTHIDKMETYDMLKLMNDENKLVPLAVEKVLPEIAVAVEKIAANLESGGRLIYIGAGTSGRLGVVDAAECPPTFGVGYEAVRGIIAGGMTAMYKAAEVGEDSGEAGVRDISGLELTVNDSVIGISAAGGAAYVAEALKYAKSKGCFTACITSNIGTLIADIADVAIVPETGAEILTGSTRLKAGTAQKLILNLISTSVMIKTGKVYENMMVNVRPTNIKLHDRAVRILSEITGLDYNKASDELDSAGGSIRKAIDHVKGSR